MVTPRQNTFFSRTNNAVERNIAVETNGKHNRNPNDELKHSRDLKSGAVHREYYHITKIDSLAKPFDLFDLRQPAALHCRLHRAYLYFFEVLCAGLLSSSVLCMHSQASAHT